MISGARDIESERHQASPPRTRPIATLCVLGITSVLTALQVAGVPVLPLLERTPGMLARGECWRLITPIFVNRGGWPEIAVNLLAPAALGILIERWYGVRWFLALYLTSGVVGELAGCAWKPVGAGSSVSVMGLAGAAKAWLVLRNPATSALTFGAVLVIVGLALTALHNLHGPPCRVVLGRGWGLALSSHEIYDMTVQPFVFTAPIALVADLVQWVASRQRTYRETMEAWRTSCPRLPVWEDAIQVGFLSVARDDAKGQIVIVTPEGRAFLEARIQRTS